MGETIEGKPLVDFEISLPRETRLLTYIRDKFDVKSFYYPGSGLDGNPKRIFGRKCINGTLLESKNYFTDNAQDVIADYRRNPFSTGVFDVVYLHVLCGQSSLEEGLPELSSLVKPGGLLVWIDETLYDKQQHCLDIINELGLVDITPPEFREPVGEWEVGFEDPKKGGHKIIIFQKPK